MRWDLLDVQCLGLDRSEFAAEAGCDSWGLSDSTVRVNFQTVFAPEQRVI